MYRLTSRLRLLLPGGNWPWLTNLRQYDAQPRRILCMTSAGMGDTIMDAPAIHSLKQKFPKAQLSVLVHYNRGAHEVCRLMPSVDETIDLGLKNYRWPTVIRFMLGGFWKLLFKLRRRKFDLAVVFFPNPVRRLLLFGLGSKHWIYGNLMDDYPGEQNRRLVQLAGIDSVESENVFEVPEPSDPQAILPDDLPRPLIGVHPFCGMAWRGWSKFEHLQTELMKLDGSVVAVGRKDGYNAQIGVHDLVNRLAISELFWAIRHFDVFVTADSGPMHIGLVLGVPTVAVFGPVPPRLRVPLAAEDKVKVIFRPSNVSDRTEYATDRKTLDNTAMQNISIQEVISATRDFLAST